LHGPQRYLAPRIRIVPGICVIHEVLHPKIGDLPTSLTQPSTGAPARSGMAPARLTSLFAAISPQSSLAAAKRRPEHLRDAAPPHSDAVAVQGRLHGLHGGLLGPGACPLAVARLHAVPGCLGTLVAWAIHLPASSGLSTFLHQPRAVDGCPAAFRRISSLCRRLRAGSS